ncbi:hypothetical protein PILCRDRAFT_114505 [Piloderma croceum F 1598]|uniref:Uncharacterized protein n=1 Tax=Piloderma croceum (strain F 1598) TaxID=765440 RepID=A0A0C3C055_PILCF|nr:hypothetical protein PILCRDRAFT_114505 [Piloderma croceum F 1598]
MRPLSARVSQGKQRQLHKEAIILAPLRNPLLVHTSALDSGSLGNVSPRRQLHFSKLGSNPAVNGHF